MVLWVTRKCCRYVNLFKNFIPQCIKLPPFSEFKLENSSTLNFSLWYDNKCSIIWDISKNCLEQNRHFWSCFLDEWRSRNERFLKILSQRLHFGLEISSESTASLCSLIKCSLSSFVLVKDFWQNSQIFEFRTNHINKS